MKTIRDNAPVLIELRLNRVPKVVRNYRRMPAVINRSFVSDAANINRVAKEVVEMAAAEGDATGSAA
jgi:hypothetical protein